MKIKPEMQKAFDNFVRVNEDPYGKACVDCTIIFGDFIDDGKTFEEAEKLMLESEQGEGLTGYMMGVIINALFSFHPRGEEIKSWWNKKFGGKGDENGTINPAIMTIKE